MRARVRDKSKTYPMAAKNFFSMRAEFASRTVSLRWITSPARIFFKISFVKSEPALEPSRSTDHLRYIPTIARSGGLENFSRIENAARVVRFLQGAHQRDFAGAARKRKEVALFETDAVLGGDRAALPAQGTIDDVFDFAMRLGAAIAHARDEMQITVTEMTEHHHGHLGPACAQCALHLGDVVLHLADGETDIEGEDRRVLAHLHDVVAQGPKPGALVFRFGDRRIGDLANFEFG